MEHVDDETLALLALGEAASDADRAHVDACERCGDELATLTSAVAAGRGLTPADALEAPSPQVWQRITADLGLGAPLTEAEPGVGVVTPLRPARPRRTGWLVAAAAAAGLVVGGVGVQALNGVGTPDDAGSVVARAALEPLPGWDASGAAVVEESDDGELTLVLTLDGQPDDAGFREVWLIDRDVTRLISLGVLEGSEGRFTLPRGVDLADFAVVDVSEEPYDGDPAHSGDSIIRGILDV